jgi:hypothetical protein
MKPNYYLIISNCVERGAALGFDRAHKHIDNPTTFEIKEKIYDAIMELINEHFFFEPY